MDRVVEKSHTAQGNSEYLNSNSSWNYMMGRVEHEIGRDLGHKDYDTGKEDIGSGDIVVGALDLEQDDDSFVENVYYIEEAEGEDKQRDMGDRLCCNSKIDFCCHCYNRCEMQWIEDRNFA